MRRALIAGALAAAMLLIGSPAYAGTGSAAGTGDTTAGDTTASTPPAQQGWFPVPEGAFDEPAGARCDFAIHVQPLVSEVIGHVLLTYPDGTPKAVLYQGPLIVRVTNTSTGAYYDANAGGKAIIYFGTDGSMTWYVQGPTLIGFGPGAGNLPRGMYLIDGVYTVNFSATGYRTLTMVEGSAVNVCSYIS